MTAVQHWWRAQSFRFRVGLIALLGLIWRLAYVNLEQPYRILTDEAWYVTQAHRLFSAHPFTSLFDYSLPTAQHGPLISILVSPFAWLFPDATAGLRFLIPFIGVFTILGFAVLGRQLVSERCGVIAAAVAALLPDFWVRDGLVASESLSVALLVWLLVLLHSFLREPRLRTSIALGLLVGALTLTRAECAGLCLILLGFLVWKLRSQWRTAVRHCAVVVLISATVVAPWVAFNSSRFESTVLLTNNLGITLAGANCHAAYYDGRYIGYDTPTCWDAAHAKALAVSTDESVQSAFMKSMAVDYVRANITRIPLVMTMREAWLVGMYRPSYVVFMSSLGGQPRWATWMQMLGFWILAGAALTLSFVKRRGPKRILDPLRTPVVLYILFTLALAAVFVGHWRYRSTLDIALVLIIASRLSMGLSEKK
jgi:4-amino-4-deoxy-L-arabinose transferase-like glycosyltransferase